MVKKKIKHEFPAAKRLAVLFTKTCTRLRLCECWLPPCRGMINPGWIAIVLTVVLLFPACTETIELDLDSTANRLVVEGMFSSDQQLHYVRLTESVPFYSESESPAVRGANVVISDGERTERLSEVSQLPGFYVTSGNFIGVPGNTYDLTISGVNVGGVNQDETYTASCYMPFVTRPDSIDLVYDSNWDIWKVLLYAEENSETEDYYMFRLFKNGSLISNYISESSVVSDKFFDGGRAEGVWVQSINARKGSEQLQDGDIITLQMAGITRQYYNYIDAIQRESRKQYPLFSGPPANAPGNISGDALGFFAAFSVAYASYRFEAE